MAEKKDKTAEDQYPAGSKFFRSSIAGMTVLVNADDEEARKSVRFAPHAYKNGMGDIDRVGFLFTDDADVIARLEQLHEVVQMSEKDFRAALDKSEPLGFAQV